MCVGRYFIKEEIQGIWNKLPIYTLNCFAFFIFLATKKKRLYSVVIKKRNTVSLVTGKKKEPFKAFVIISFFFLFPRFIRYHTCYVCKHLQNHQKFQIQQNTNYNTITDIIKQSVWEQFAHKSSPKCSKTAADVFMLHAAHFRCALTAP